MAGEGPLAAAKLEIQNLKQKLVQCNLSTMKQMGALGACRHTDGQLKEDTIIFHEPLQYLDEDSKDLVLTIVCDKLRQLEIGHAPPSLVAALTRHANILASQDDGASMQELLETRAELEASQCEARTLRLKLEDAETLIVMRTQELANVKAKLAETQEALAELQEQERVLRVAYAELQEVSVRQQVEIARQQREIERINAELENERQANSKLREEVERLQGRLREYERRVQQLERDFAELQQRFDILEAEANEMREELARRNNTRTQGTQTSLTGPKLDEQVAETKRLKVMLEELQMKLKELIDKYRRKFGSEAKHIATELGMDALLKEDTVFQRLYDDALDRVDRLEKLRAKIRKERSVLKGVAEVPSSEGSVLAAVEQSDLKGPCRFMDTIEREPQSIELPATPSPLKLRMKSSISLPMLPPNSQSVAVVDLDFGQRKSRARR